MGTEFEDEPPLDPVLENVRRKLVRRMAWSIGIMMIGLMTVLGAIVYKLNVAGNPAALAGSETPLRIELPTGAEVISSSLDNNKMQIGFKTKEGSYRIMIVDLASGDVISNVDLVPAR
ncbi:MAG: fimbrial protein [Pseudomonadota bacterium]